MYKASIESKTWKFEAVMNKIKQYNEEAYNWLMQIGPKKWALSHDGENRYGCMTINLSESLNSVLKKIRALLIQALVDAIFTKVVENFNLHRSEASHCNKPFPP
jgi:hypothetical protein